jgi:hypothetical protein
MTALSCNLSWPHFQVCTDNQKLEIVINSRVSD